LTWATFAPYNKIIKHQACKKGKMMTEQEMEEEQQLAFRSVCEEFAKNTCDHDCNCDDHQ
jgi:hypothetical protein